MPRHEMGLFEVERAAQEEARAPAEISAVLMEGAVPQQFCYPPQALLEGSPL